MSYLDDCARVYRPTGRMAHLLRPNDSPSVGYPQALCGMRNPLFSDWLGTGSQAEHERAAQLPLCPGCEQGAIR